MFSSLAGFWIQEEGVKGLSWCCVRTGQYLLMEDRKIVILSLAHAFAFFWPRRPPRTPFFLLLEAIRARGDDEEEDEDEEGEETKGGVVCSCSHRGRWAKKRIPTP